MATRWMWWVCSLSVLASGCGDDGGSLYADLVQDTMVADGGERVVLPDSGVADSGLRAHDAAPPVPPRDANTDVATAWPAPLTRPNGQPEQILGAALGESVGGNPWPMLLFADGWTVLTNEFMKMNVSAQAHRASKPGQWARWRFDGDRVETERSSGWTRAPYDGELQPLPAGTKRASSWVYVDGLDLGSGVAVFEERWRFFADGTFAYCKVITAAGSGTYSRSPEKRAGTYTLDGFVLAARDTSGVSERFSYVVDPEQERGWVDGRMYQEEWGPGTLLDFIARERDGKATICEF